MGDVLCETCLERGKERPATRHGAFGHLCEDCFGGKPTRPEETVGDVQRKDAYRAYYQRNRDKVLKRNRDWKKKNRRRVAAYGREWRKRSKQKGRKADPRQHGPGSGR